VPEYIYCEQDPDSGELACEKFVPESPDPVWSISIEGIEGNLAGFPPPVVYDGSRLYLLAGGENVYVLDMEIP
jgi:hypothetical protein